MKTLDEISTGFRKKTDKSSLFHNYTKLYTLYFEPLREEKLRILEIGIDKGYSLKVWKEYFPNAEMIGLDIIDLKHMEQERIRVVQGDQKDCMTLKKISEKYGPFDIVIDDGSHYNDDMKASFECLFPLLKPGGMYVVEDIHACYWPSNQIGKGPSFAETLKKLVDDVHSSGKSDCANREQDDEIIMSGMSWWEKNVEFLHLYRSIAFIKKYPPLFKDLPVSTVGRFIVVGNVTPPAKIKRGLSFFERARRKIKREFGKMIDAA